MQDFALAFALAQGKLARLVTIHKMVTIQNLVTIA
jgi:hypothetical protein